MIEFVMVEQLGKNLRNNIAHGLSDIKAFRKKLFDGSLFILDDYCYQMGISVRKYRRVC